jgi:ArsR family metal-binding transcriptional regulator
MLMIMAFPRLDEFHTAKMKLDELNLSYQIIYPPLGYENIAVPAIVFEQEVYAELIKSCGGTFVFSGCVDYNEPLNPIEENQEDSFADVFGKAYIMVLTPCVADETKIRIIAHLSEDMSKLLPYLNTYMQTASYNDDTQSLTFMEQHRLITIYKNRIAIARADDITDAWRMIAKIRSLINTVNQQIDSMQPTYEMRKKPPALEIYNHLPKINCGQCQQKTCMAFAFALHSGKANPFACKPIFEGDYKQLTDAFMEICSKIGMTIVE